MQIIGLQFWSIVINDNLLWSIVFEVILGRELRVFLDLLVFQLLIGHLKIGNFTVHIYLFRTR